MSIVQIDMHIRDERLYEYLAENQKKPLKSKDITKVMKCHRHTVREMVKRLERAGKITVTRGTKGGHIYECKQ